MIYAEKKINCSGIVKYIGLEIYADKDLTTLLTLINWGALVPDQMAGVSAYIKNTENVPYTLSMTTLDFVPDEVKQYLTVAWDYVDGYVIQPNEVLSVQITLKVSADVKGIYTFSFIINVKATEKEAEG